MSELIDNGCECVGNARVGLERGVLPTSRGVTGLATRTPHVDRAAVAGIAGDAGGVGDAVQVVAIGIPIAIVVRVVVAVVFAAGRAEGAIEVGAVRLAITVLVVSPPP